MLIQVEYARVKFLSNYRQAYDDTFVSAVAGSIAANGYDATYPMKVYRDGETFIVIDGNTRWHACELAQVYDVHTRQAIPLMVWVSVVDKPANDGEFVLQQVEANNARRQPDPVSDGAAYQRMLDAGIPAADIARRCHTTVTAINNRTALLTLVDEIKELVVKGHLPLTFAAAMTALDTNRQRIALVAYNKAKSPNINDFKDKCSELYQQQLAEAQTSMFALFSVEEIEAQAAAMAEQISSEPRKSVKQLEAELEAERKARKADRDYALREYRKLQMKLEQMMKASAA